MQITLSEVKIMEITPIARIYNDFDSKFAVPRQSGLVNTIKSKIIFEKEYASYEAFKGLEGYSHLWLIWEFDKNAHKSSALTVRPPRLGGNERVGVFATRSPYRPNPLGLSSVKLEEIINENGKVSLIVSGADLVNGTKIYDIKPYLTYSDCHEDAICGFGDEKKDYSLSVVIPEKEACKLDGERLATLKAILSCDPRPAYQKDEREYGFSFAKKEIKFKVRDDELTVLGIYDER